MVPMVLLGRNSGAMRKYGTFPSYSAKVARSGLEGRRHEAEAVTAGDADGGKRDAADPATGVNHNF